MIDQSLLCTVPVHRGSIMSVHYIPEICTGNICECIAAVPVLAVDRIIADCNDSF